MGTGGRTVTDNQQPVTLKGLREARGIRKTDLAARITAWAAQQEGIHLIVNLSNVTNWEAGRVRNIRPIYRRALAFIYGVDPADIDRALAATLQDVKIHPKSPRRRADRPQAPAMTDEERLALIRSGQPGMPRTPGQSMTDAERKSVQAAMIAAIREKGRLVAALKTVGINSMTHYSWMRKYPEYRQAINAALAEGHAKNPRWFELEV